MRRALLWLTGLTLCLSGAAACSTSGDDAPSQPVAVDTSTDATAANDGGLIDSQADVGEDVADTAAPSDVTETNADVVLPLDTAMEQDGDVGDGSDGDGDVEDASDGLQPGDGQELGDGVGDDGLGDDGLGDDGLGDAVDTFVAEVIDTAQPDTAPVDTKNCPFGLTPTLLNCGFQGVCAGTVKVICVNDLPTCDYSGVPNYEPLEVTCDGLDNDCSGAVDNNLSKPIAQSWPNAGVCKKALKVCAGSKGWQEPTGAEIPGYEADEMSCDGLDNDCDGLTDSDITSKPPLSSGLGVCGKLTKVCTGGIWQDPNPTQAPQFEPAESTCDGLDNDCDGLTDESLYPPNPLPVAVTVLQTGLCTGAKAVCKGGTWVAPDYASYVASFGPGPAYELKELSCDGVDNDCDGQTDEDLVGPPASNQAGVCAGLRKVCKGGLGWQDPALKDVPQVTLGPETTCDAVDNDCDGVTDEESVCPKWQLGGRTTAGAAVGGSTTALAVGAALHIFQGDKLVRQDFRHPQPIEAIALSTDGSRLASCSRDAVLRVQKLSDGELLHKVDAPGKTWTAVSWAPDGQLVATGDAVGWLRVVSLAPKPGGSFGKKLFSGPVNHVRWLAQGKFAGLRIIAGGSDGKIRALQPVTGATWTWQPSVTPAGPIADIALHEDLAAITWSQGGVAVFGVNQGAPTGPTFALTLPGRALTFDSQGRLWHVDDQGDVRRYDDPGSGDWKLSWSFAGPSAPGSPLALRWLPSNQLLLSGERATGRVDLKGKWSPLWSGTDASVGSLATGSGVWGASGGQPTVRYGGAAGQTGDFTPAGGENVATLALSPVKSRLLTRGTNGAMRVWEVPPQAKASWAGSAAGTGPVAWQPDASAHWRGEGSKLWRTEVSTGLSAVWHSASASIDAIGVSAKGDRLAYTTKGPSKQLFVLSVATQNMQWSRGQLVSLKHAVAWRPDGSELLVSGGPAKLELLSATNGVTISKLPGHLGEVVALGWSADGARFLSASDDGIIRLWRRTKSGALGEMTSARHCRWPCPLSGGVAGAGFLSSKQWLSLGSDGALISWSLPPL